MSVYVYIWLRRETPNSWKKQYLWRTLQGGNLEKESQKRDPGRGILKEGSWRSNPEGWILKEESWKRKHGEGFLGTQKGSGGPRWALGPPADSPGETSRGPQDPPRISLKAPRGLSVLNRKVCWNRYGFLKKVARATFSPARERGNMHEVPRLRTKVVREIPGFTRHWPKARITKTARTPIAKAIYGKNVLFPWKSTFRYIIGPRKICSIRYTQYAHNSFWTLRKWLY